MGGTGSGRPRGWARGRVETQSALDVRKMAREGALRPGRRCTWTWRLRGAVIASVETVTGDGGLEASYRLDGRPVAVWVAIVRTPCNYGGDRPWFQCPACHGRAATIYLCGPTLRCRRCARLAYTSQTEGALDRILRKVRKVASAWGPGQAMIDPIWCKPKGMHQATFDRMKWQAERTWLIAARPNSIGWPGSLHALRIPLRAGAE